MLDTGFRAARIAEAHARAGQYEADERAGMAQGDGDGGQLDLTRPTAAPDFTASDSVWAGCPFHASEAFNLAGVGALLRVHAGRMASAGNPNGAREINAMADMLRVTRRKIQSRVVRELEMAAAQAGALAP